MGRPRKNPDLAATTDRVLAAAEIHFGAHGLAGARLEAIAAEAGIQRSSLLYHFGSKEALHAAVVSRAFEELGATVAAGLAEGRGRAAEATLDALVERLLAFAEGRPALVSVVHRELVAPQSSGAEAVQRGFAAWVAQLERALREVAGSAAIPDGFPLRDAILHLLAGFLLRHAMTTGAAPGPALWGPVEAVRRLARALLLGQRDAEAPTALASTGAGGDDGARPAPWGAGAPGENEEP